MFRCISCILLIMLHGKERGALKTYPNNISSKETDSKSLANFQMCTEEVKNMHPTISPVIPGILQ